MLRRLPHLSKIAVKLLEIAGAGCASAELFPNRRLNLILRRIVHQRPEHSVEYHFPPGSEALRRQIARRSLETGCTFSPGDITITCGALEAINLAQKAVCPKCGEVLSGIQALFA